MTDRFYPTRPMSDLWDDLARENATSAVCYHMTEEQLDESGRVESAWLWRLMQQLARARHGDPNEAGTLCVLDIGGGVGRLAKYLAPKVRRYTLLDVSAVMLEHAQARCPQVPSLHFLQGTGTDLAGVDSGCVDFALSEMCFQHVDREIVFRYLGEVARVLRPNGWAYLQVPPMDWAARREDGERGDWPANFRRWQPEEFLRACLFWGLVTLAANFATGEYLLGRAVAVNWGRTEERADGDDGGNAG